MSDLQMIGITVFNSASLVIFCTFAVLIMRELKRRNQSLDGYMKVTLILMFLSLVIVNFEAFALFPEDTLTRRILSIYIQGIPS